MSGRPPWPDEKSALCFSLRIDGYSYGDIASRMGISRNAVAGYLWRHGVIEAPELARWHEARRERDVVCARDYEIPTYRANDDRKHLTLMLAAMRKEGAA